MLLKIRVVEFHGEMRLFYKWSVKRYAFTCYCFLLADCTNLLISFAQIVWDYYPSLSRLLYVVFVLHKRKLMPVFHMWLVDFYALSAYSYEFVWMVNNTIPKSCFFILWNIVWMVKNSCPIAWQSSPILTSSNPSWRDEWDAWDWMFTPSSNLY